MIKTKTVAIIFIGLILSSLAFATANDGDFTLNVDERHSSIQLEELDASGKCLKLRVKNGGETVQTIEYRYSRESLENAVFVERRYELSDVNFDGHDDLLIYLGSYGNQGVVYKDCFLWDAAASSFERCETFKCIPNPVVDTQGGFICGSARRNAGHYVFELWSWSGGNLRNDCRIHKVHSAAQLPSLYGMEVPSGEDAGEYALRSFGIELKFYDSVFYVKENLCEGVAKFEPPICSDMDSE
ncbi:MAG: hypothetical protein K2H67_07585, partial [Treponemataceae bacterium]|nr:hypothetical protein [Treponemataceae bacterium]